MKLICNNYILPLEFSEVELVFKGSGFTNVFASKNNKSLSETLKHKRYSRFAAEVNASYSAYLEWALGDFLLHLKANKDPFYTKFLNRHGDQIYCWFSIEDKQFLEQKGIYAFGVGEQVNYVGRCKDLFKKRINQGYGRIHPKNCFVDGQATNCHVNAKIEQCREDIRLFVSVMTDNDQIESIEKEIIQASGPIWNIALKSKS